MTIEYHHRCIFLYWLDINALDELRNEDYESARLFKAKVKMWHDRKIQK